MPFKIIKSSAGSGKTFTLVKEYINLAVKNSQLYKNIVAITFTNKAANEMKERILKKLKSLSFDNNEILYEILKKNYNNINIKETSKKILSNILHDYSNFHIKTIDSLIYKIIRSIALELNFPLYFDVELDLNSFIDYSIDKLFELVGHNNYIENLLMNFIESKIFKGKSWNIENDIRNTIYSYYNEKNYVLMNLDNNKISENNINNKEIINYKINNLINKIKNEELKYREFFKIQGEKVLKLINSQGLKKDDFYNKGKGNYSYFEKLVNSNNFNDFLPKDTILKGNYYKKDAPNEIKEKFEKIIGDINKIVNDIKKNIINAFTVYVLNKNIYILPLIKNLEFFIEEYKRNNNIYPIIDFNIKLSKFINKNDIPFIYVLLGESFEHFLIDEFQDTSKLQWRNILPLIENSISRNNLCVAVGDSKQAIYRWRNGDIEIMEKFIYQYNEIKNNLQEEELNKNYRSCKTIVEFNNKLFYYIGEIYKEIIKRFESEYNFTSFNFLGKIYQSVKQEVVRDDSKGEISYETLKVNNENNKKELHKEIAIKVVTIIKNLKQFKLKDIAILVRKRDEAKSIIEELIKEKINFVSADSLTISNVSSVRFIINYLKFIINKDDKLSFYSLYYIYLSIIYDNLDFENNEINFNKNQDIKIQKINQLSNSILKNNINSELIKDEYFSIILELVNKRDYLLKLPLYDMIEEIIRISKLNLINNGKHLIYIQQFLSLVLDYTSKNTVNINDFLDYWDENNSKFIVSPNENINAVKILTIHKSKGLEFPVVIIPFVEWGGSRENQDEILWLKINDENLKNYLRIDDDLKDLYFPVTFTKDLNNTYFKNDYIIEEIKYILDNINLLYVAFTRAKEQLYIFLPRTDKNLEDDNNDLIKKYSNIPKLLIGAILKSNIFDKNFENSIKSSHLLIKITNKSSNIVEKIEDNSYKNIFENAQEYISSNWIHRLTIVKNSLLINKIINNENYGKIYWGNLIHLLLSEINNKNEIDFTINKYYLKGLINQELIEKIKNEISKIIEIIENKIILNENYKILNEKSIIFNDQYYRPDKILIKKDKAIIIDYKTGEITESDYEQIKNYSFILSKMGYKNVFGYLITSDKIIYEYRL